MQVESVLALDLRCVPRIHRLNPQIRIPINRKKQATAKEKSLLLINAWKWGYNSSLSTYEECCCILRGTSRLVAYNNGYTKEFSLRSVMRWENLSIEQVLRGILSREIIGTRHKGSVSSIDALDKKYPRYMYFLFRNALHVKGSNSSLSEITCHVNITSRSGSIV